MSGDILNKSVFIISVDTELAWGFILSSQHEILTLLRNDPKRVRGIVDWLLKLFKKYEIPATWAVVGHLFLEPGEEKGLISREMPQFKDGWLSWDFYNNLKSNPLYYGRDIVEKIMASSLKHEIGLHGFFHIPFSQLSRELAEAEIEPGVKLAQKFGITPKSFVFPGNYIGHLDVLRDHGFQIYRGENAGRYHEGQNPPIRLLNSAIDKLIAPPVVPLRKDGIWELPGSAYFCDPRFPFTLLPRARLGLERTIRASKVFHIWLHPWTLLLYNRLAEDLEKLLAIVAQKRDEDKIEVMTTGSLPDYLNGRERVGL